MTPAQHIEAATEELRRNSTAPTAAGHYRPILAADREWVAALTRLGVE